MDPIDLGTLNPAARAVVDRAVRALAIDRPDPGAALELIEKVQSLPGRQRSGPEAAGSHSSRWWWEGRLDSDQAAMVFWTLPEQVLIFVVRRDGSVVIRSSQVDRRQLARLTDRMDEHRREVDEDIDLASQTLFELLVEPALGALEGARRLVITREGPLTSVPFVLLTNPSTGRRLIENFEIQIAPSIAALRVARTAGARRHTNVLVVADPTDAPLLDGTAVSLPGARAEARAVSALYSAPIVLEGEQATESATESALAGGIELLHFAGHGESLTASPGESWLALRPDGLDDGRWTANEIGQLELERAWLAVVASCGSGAVSDPGLDDLSGLAEGLLRAGFRNIVTAKWPVPDAASSKLLTDFHETLLQGGSIAEALRRAQLDSVARGESASVWGNFEVVSVQPLDN